MRAQICLTFIAFVFVSNVAFITCNLELDKKTEAKFAAKIFRELPNVKSANQLISPSSLRRSIGLMRIGGSGKTSGLLANFGEFNGDNEKVSQTMSSALKNLESVELRSVYFTQENKIHHTFRRRIEEMWGFKRNKKFRASKINKWIESETEEKVQSLIRSRDINSKTTQVTVDILKYNAKWKHPFTNAFTDKFNNGTDKYHVEIYQQENKFLYGEFDAWKARAMILPFADGQTEMLLLLPRNNSALNDLLKSLEKVDITKIKSKLAKQKVKVYLPKIKLKFGVPVKKALQNSNVGDIFTDKGRFLNLVHNMDPLVKNFQHEVVLETTMLELNALAVSTVIWENKKNPILDSEADEDVESENVQQMSRSKLIMDFDRPFFYAIIAGENILFAGTIRNL